MPRRGTDGRIGRGAVAGRAEAAIVRHDSRRCRAGLRAGRCARSRHRACGWPSRARSTEPENWSRAASAAANASKSAAKSFSGGATTGMVWEPTPVKANAPANRTMISGADDLPTRRRQRQRVSAGATSDIEQSCRHAEFSSRELKQGFGGAGNGRSLPPYRARPKANHSSGGDRGHRPAESKLVPAEFSPRGPLVCWRSVTP